VSARTREQDCGDDRALLSTAHDLMVGGYVAGGALAVGAAVLFIAATAATQCDGVLPAAPYRQWVLSLPWALRLPVARDPSLLNAVSRVFFEEVRAWRRRAR